MYFTFKSTTPLETSPVWVNTFNSPNPDATAARLVTHRQNIDTISEIVPTLM
jgi:hypothetical protein